MYSSGEAKREELKQRGYNEDDRNSSPGLKKKSKKDIIIKTGGKL